MKQKILSLFFLCGLGFQNANSQNTSPFWSLVGNSNARDTSKLGTTNNIPLRLFTNNSERMRITGGGKVGIGIVNPAAKVQIKYNSSVTDPQLLLYEDESDYARLNFKNNISNSTFWSIAALNGSVIPNDRLHFYNSGTGNVFSITGRGNIGINTSDPVFPLTFPDAVGDKISLFGNGGPHYGFGIQGALLQIHSNNSAADIAFGYGSSTAFTEVMRVKGNGTVGIGTLTPTGKFEVKTTGGNNLIARFTNSSTTGDRTALVDILNGDGVVWRHAVGGTNNGLGLTQGQYYVERVGSGALLTITTAGNVGIGTTAPVNKLDVCGTIRAKELRVETGWCDYVFDKDYKLAPLSDVENFINTNKHLPGVTSGSEIETQGLQVGRVSSQMIKKIEELTLYIIEQEKSINNLKEQNKKFETIISSLITKGGK